MMDLFGGFDRACMQAYEATYPIDAPLRRALPLFQLIPLLVHVILFGAGYIPGVRANVRTLESTLGGSHDR